MTNLNLSLHDTVHKVFHSSSSSDDITTTYAQSLIDEGYLVTQLWPSIVRHVQTNYKNHEDMKGGKDAFLRDASLLFALLVNYQGSFFSSASASDSSHGHPPLSFLLEDSSLANFQDKKVAFEAILTYLLLHSQCPPLNDDSNDPVKVKDHALSLEKHRLSFLIHAFQSLDVGRIVSDCLMPMVGVSLYEYVPQRGRELELARVPWLKRVWEKYKGQTASSAGDTDRSAKNQHQLPPKKKAKVSQQESTKDLSSSPCEEEENVSYLQYVSYLYHIIYNIDLYCDQIQIYVM